jgi:hypothetical protein
MTPSFKNIKTELQHDLRYGGDPYDSFWHDQFLAFYKTIQKAKGWEDTIWRLRNAPAGLITFQTHSLELWIKALTQHCFPLDVTPDVGTPEYEIRMQRDYFDTLRKEYEKLMKRPRTNKLIAALRELRAAMVEVDDKIFDLQFPEVVNL